MSAAEVKEAPAAMAALATEATAAGPIMDDEFNPMDTQEMEEAKHDVYLFEHNRRFQAAVLRTMDTQIAQIEDQLMLKQNELQSSEKVREDLALSFNEMKRELLRLNKQYEKISTALYSSSHNEKTLSNEKLHLEHELSHVQSHSSKTQKQIQRLEKELTRCQDELHAGKQLHGIFNSDLTMYRQMKENLLLEIRNLQHEIKSRNNNEVALKHKLEQSHNEIHQFKQDFKDQTMETKKAQMEVENLVHELTLSRSAHTLLSQQWQTALSNLSQRDKIMQEVVNTHESTRQQNVVMAMQEKAMLVNMEKKERALHVSENDRMDVQQRYDAIHSAHKSLQSQYADMMSQYQLLLDTSNRNDQFIIKYEKDKAHNEQELARNIQRYTILQNAHAELQNQFDSEVQQKLELAHALSTGDKTKMEKLAHEMVNEQSRRRNLEYEKQLEINKNTELSEQIKGISKSNEMLLNEYQRLEKQNSVQSEEQRQLNISLEHMTYRANKAESEMQHLRVIQQEQHRSEAMAMQGEIRHLEMEIKKKQSEIYEMNRAYVLAEEKVLEAHKAHTDILHKTDKLKQELTSVYGIKDRMYTQIHELEGEKRGLLLENNEERLTIRKHEEQISSLLKDRESLQLQVNELQGSGKQRQAELEHEVTLLKAEVVKRKNTRGEVVTLLEESERERNLLERKLLHLSTKYERCLREKEQMEGLYKQYLKTQQAEKKQNTIAERQYAVWLKHFEIICDRQSRRQNKLPTHELHFSKSQALTTQQILNNFYEAHPHIYGPAASNPALAQSTSSIPTLPALTDRRAAGAARPAGSIQRATQDDIALRPSATNTSKPALHGAQSAAHIPTAMQLNAEYFSSELGNTHHQSNRNAFFLEQLVMELRQTLQKTSVQSAERFNEIVKLKHDNRSLQKEIQEARASSLLPRMHRLQTDYTLLSHCYDRALSVAAGLDRQLIADKMRIMMELEHKVGVKQEDVINLVDYQYYHNLKPSQILMDAVNDKALAMSSSSGSLTADDSSPTLHTLQPSVSPPGTHESSLTALQPPSANAPATSTSNQSLLRSATSNASLLHGASSTSSLKLRDLMAPHRHARLRVRRFIPRNKMNNNPSATSLDTNSNTHLTSTSSLGVSPFASTSSLLPPSTANTSTSSLQHVVQPSRIAVWRRYDAQSSSMNQIVSVQTENPPK